MFFVCFQSLDSSLVRNETLCSCFHSWWLNLFVIAVILPPVHTDPNMDRTQSPVLILLSGLNVRLSAVWLHPLDVSQSFLLHQTKCPFSLSLPLTCEVTVTCEESHLIWVWLRLMKLHLNFTICFSSQWGLWLLTLSQEEVWTRGVDHNNIIYFISHTKTLWGGGNVFESDTQRNVVSEENEGEIIVFSFYRRTWTV